MLVMRIERSIVVLLVIASIGLTAVSISEDWEFWMPPVIIVMTVALIVMHFRQKVEENNRMILYFVFAGMLTFYHGVHETSLYDVGVVMMIFMGVITLMDSIRRLNIALGEYAFIMVIQLFLLNSDDGQILRRVDISGLILHVVAVICMYSFCRTVMRVRHESDHTLDECITMMKESDKDTEDFLTNTCFSI